MKIWVERDGETGIMYEWEERTRVAVGESCSCCIEVPDAIVNEWRTLTARLEEIERYFDRERIAQHFPNRAANAD